MSAAILEREVFTRSRDNEYLHRRELEMMTGQAADNFAHVLIKELLDNALDACERANVAPDIQIEAEVTPKTLRLTVTDNGDGMPTAVIHGLRNWNECNSTNIGYRSPTRGQQGNALKTILGIPYALGMRPASQLAIECHGVQHTVSAWLSLAGDACTDFQESPSDLITGTRLTVTIPYDHQEAYWNPPHWVACFSLFNPHARLKLQTQSFLNSKYPGTDGAEKSEFVFEPLVAFPEDRWRKFLPTDPTSAHWYDPASLALLVSFQVKNTPDRPVIDLVRKFRGLSRKIKPVADMITSPTLATLEREPGQISTLLDAMKAHATPPRPDILGVLGREHFRRWFQSQYEITDSRYWYKQAVDTLPTGIPYVIEVAIAETERNSALFYGLNFSRPFDDPLSTTRLSAGEISGYGIRNFLKNAYVLEPFEKWLNFVAAVHITCPLLTSLDRGKSRLSLPPQMAKAVADTLWNASKTVWQEQGKARKENKTEGNKLEKMRRLMATQGSVTYIRACFTVMMDAYNATTQDGTIYVDPRDLYYAVRPLLEAFKIRPDKRRTKEELGYGNFSQKILPRYRRTVHPLPMVTYKPRGELHQPHGGPVWKIGTREMKDFEFPLWLYNKILFIEKEGVWRTLCEPGMGGQELANRYDMAVISSEGYSTEEIRLLLEKASKSMDYQIFVWHDADASGYNIARTLHQETERMPGFSIEIVDIGLHLQEALKMDLPLETFERKKAIPQGLVLNELEKKHFIGKQTHDGKGTSRWSCQRVEINAIPVDQRAAYLERKIQEAGCVQKVMPPTDHLMTHAADEFKDAIRDMIKDDIDRRLNIDDLVSDAIKVITIPDMSDAPDAIRAAWAKDDSQSWRNALKTFLKEQVDPDAITKAVTESLKPKG
jgi:hypothetical protein